MKVEYRKLFLKDLKKLKNQPIYKQIIDLVFKQIPSVNCLQDLSQVKAMKGYYVECKVENFVYFITKRYLERAREELLDRLFHI
ncbi:hypothetical protein [Geminocystis sp.]|uniref:hypothetical protein n=1 Tax=Geminocystis sp. TaxID=2664100 RepID=UPI003593082E